MVYGKDHSYHEMNIIEVPGGCLMLNRWSHKELKRPFRSADADQRALFAL
jgi:hypothetical protein